MSSMWKGILRISFWNYLKGREGKPAAANAEARSEGGRLGRRRRVPRPRPRRQAEGSGRHPRPSAKPAGAAALRASAQQGRMQRQPARAGHRAAGLPQPPPLRCRPTPLRFAGSAAPQGRPFSPSARRPAPAGCLCIRYSLLRSSPQCRPVCPCCRGSLPLPSACLLATRRRRPSLPPSE